MFCIISCDFNLYTVRNVFAKNLFFKLFGQIFEASPRYMFLDHVDSFGNLLFCLFVCFCFVFFFLFLSKKTFLTLLKKKGARTLFLLLSQKYSSL